MKKILLALVAFLLVSTAAYAQTVRNPTAAEFNSPDHGNPAVTSYEFDISTSTGGVVQTITVPKASVVLVSGELGAVGALYRININVQPVAFGTYVSVMRTVAGAIKSEDSSVSNVWERSPGAPSKPVLK